jgi:ABC-type transport system involved in cytochrome bd biosynthesis fused ATPase/permease subunit
MYCLFDPQCGPSGCGKSTCISLLMKFYGTCEGSIEVDGRNITELNLHWLRSQIGYVAQVSLHIPVSLPYMCALCTCNVAVYNAEHTLSGTGLQLVLL